MKLLYSLPTAGNLEKSGVYFIQNTSNLKVYIGSAVNICKRWSLHRRQLKKGSHNNRYLLRAFRKSPYCLVFGVFEFCDRSEILTREQYYCDLFLSYRSQNGYNIRTEVTSNLGYKVTDDVRNRISKSMTGRKQSPEHSRKQCEARRGRKNTIENIELQSKMKSRYSDDQLTRIIADIEAKMRPDDVMHKHLISRKTYYKLKNKTGYRYFFNGIDRKSSQAA